MALDTSKPLHSVAPFSHSFAGDFNSKYLQTYHPSHSHPGLSKKQPSERHSSHRNVSHSRTESTLQTLRSFSSVSVSEGLAQEPSDHIRPVSDDPERQSALPGTLSPHASAKYKYGALRGTFITNTDTLPQSRSQHGSFSGTRSTSGSGSDLGSGSKAHSSLWHAYPYQGSSVHPHLASISQRKASSQHIRSGSISDGSVAIPVDMKRLLSKPAFPSPSPSSLFSDSDSQYSSRHRQRPRSTSRIRTRLKIPLDSSTGPSRPDESSQGKENPLLESPTPMTPSPIAPKPISDPSPSPKDQKWPKPRHLVKRRPSSNNVNVVKAPIPSIPLALSVDGARTRHPPTSSSVVRSASRSPGDPRQNSNPSTSHNSPFSALTPAGAVAEAYKQQQARREDLASASQRGDDSYRGRSQIIGRKPGDVVTPYYTILGSRTSKVVAVDGPGDGDWDSELEAVLSTEERLRLSSLSSTPRTLPRKISGKWKKVRNSCDVGCRDSSLPVNTSGNDTVNDYRHRLNEARRMNRDHDDPNTPGLLLEKFADVPPKTEGTKTQSELPQSEKQMSTPRRVHSEMLSGGKVWKLMKRISSGGMREKYQQQEQLPPVPALPKHSLYQNGTGSQDGHEGDHAFEMLSRFMQSRTSMSAARPLSRNPSPRLESLRRAALVTNLGPRASATTRSSSPGSSVIAFARSQQSSSSSHVEESSNSPQYNIGQHIIPPSELYLFDNDTSPQFPTMPPPPTRNMSRRADDWISRSPEVELASLPCPPVRPAVISQDVSSDRVSSPIIPSFSMRDAINTFGSRKASHVASDSTSVQLPLTVVTSSTTPGSSSTPPPRPPRNPKRTLSTSRSVVRSAPSDPSHTPPVTGTQDVGKLVTNLHRRKTSSDIQDTSATARTRRRSNSLEAQPRRQRKMTLTFRELGEATTPTLTEREKADKWDDLLARSARAGGTLHIGGDELILNDPQLSDVSATTFGQDEHAS